MIKKICAEMITVFKKTGQLKEKTQLNACRFALIFQLIMTTSTVILGLVQMMLDFGLAVAIPFYILLGYSILSLPSFYSLLSRRLNDVNVNRYHALIVPFSYVVVGVMMMISKHNPFYALVGFIVFLITHFYLIILVLLPSTEA